jgi:hypothetical protein
MRCRLFSAALLLTSKRSRKAEPVRHTSTKIFVMWKTSGWKFFRVLHSSPEFISLSSAASVTVANTVQTGIDVFLKRGLLAELH